MLSPPLLCVTVTHAEQVTLKTKLQIQTANDSRFLPAFSAAANQRKTRDIYTFINDSNATPNKKTNNRQHQRTFSEFDTLPSKPLNRACNKSKCERLSMGSLRASCLILAVRAENFSPSPPRNFCSKTAISFNNLSLSATSFTSKALAKNALHTANAKNNKGMPTSNATPIDFLNG